ncbi:host cell division inhibitor Icd-like protein [Enterobacter kobei]|uniref:host cell division inhibitor Icd-like protein n=1 Tax=Enterobacter kobei TaxID=208224 RepID=UPI002006BE66|nr:host cell division inhibitor Icd-like protein [Enterobacter kobei]
MSDKTKAAMQGRPSHHIKSKQDQHTKPCAGGQSLSVPVITGTASMERLRETTQKLGCLGCTALAHTQSPETSGELEQSAGCTAMQQTPEDFQSAFMHSGYHSLSASLAFLRWRRLISPRIEVTINPALLSPSSLSDSISATTSCGTRTVKSCDFAFLLEVAITDSFDVWCVSVYAKKSYAQCLKCVSLECSFKSEGETHLANSEARQCSNTNRASYHNVTEAYIMACIQHTQTRPEFTWRFISASERYPTAKPLVIYVNASSEQEARDTMPGVNLIFAARLPFHAFQAMEVRHA